ncbi:uncharacterized protein LOC128554536 [Mercenaria mercenaria]|uniref:uncharacterized protein LOC128554536 n=1 Tax=Mercenaria mercenaria TaxID=6596 RepID=UPI00234F098F|nr:uncharacterized protein LOC128554536 [Mercenaria mercenaria]
MNKTECNAVTGHCLIGACKPGWQGDACDRECQYRTFGPNCSEECHCFDNSTCHPVSGVCYIGYCEAGWQGPACNKARNVLLKLKGQVNTQMSSVAHNWTANRAIDGRVGPDPGTCHCCSGTENSQLSWWRLDLSQKISIKSIIIYSRDEESYYQDLKGFQLYLTNNTAQDSSAINTNTNTNITGNTYEINVPNTLARYVTIKRLGVLTICEVMIFEGECGLGTYGEECIKECHCADNKPCNKESGQCQTLICKTGWNGTACNQGCPQDRFGDGCKERCFCAEDTCTTSYGACPGNCRQGYHGPHCNIVLEGNGVTKQSENNSNKVATIGGSVGGSVAFLIIVIAVVYLFIRYRTKLRYKDEHKNDYTTPSAFTQQSENSDYDTLETVQVNIALNKPTYQDGTLTYPEDNRNAIWSSEHAVEGKKNCVRQATYIDYSATALKAEPWWQVDLGGLYNIKKVMVYGQPEKNPSQLKGFRLYLSEVNQTSKETLVYENNSTYPDHGIFTINPENRLSVSSRYVTIYLPNTTNSNRTYPGPLVLCEVEVFISALNIAPTVSLSRSSVLSYDSHNYSEVNVIDENHLSDPDKCDCCWSSAIEYNPWLEAVIPFRAPVLTINVIGRTDKALKANITRNLTGLKIEVDSTMVPDNRILYNTRNNSVTIYPQTATVQKINFTRPGSIADWFLIICEIEINVIACASGQYGPLCENCGKCKLGTVCSSTTGICPDGCQPGFTGDKCDLMVCQCGKICKNHRRLKIHQTKSGCRSREKHQQRIGLPGETGEISSLVPNHSIRSLSAPVFSMARSGSTAEVAQSVDYLLSLQGSIQDIVPEEQDNDVPDTEEDSPIFGLTSSRDDSPIFGSSNTQTSDRVTAAEASAEGPFTFPESWRT